MSNLDLNSLLDGFGHEPGQVKARKIMGIDGREKVQLRIDLGLIQMEMNGRPDGQRPFGFESLLQYHQARVESAESRGRPYELSEAELVALQQESVQYYHRYLSLFQLRDYPNVIRDTQRNLEVLNFVSKYTQEDESKWTFEQFRPYVMMMNIRARASLEIQEGNAGKAIRLIEEGKEQIEKFYRSVNQPEWIESSSELAFLNEWLHEVRENIPLSPVELMERDLEKAIAEEAYERAAELRDAIQKMSRRIPDESVDP
ncbi:MAG TPA: UvrB/UvrC motif-containing protein [Chthoniobacterales bacterium]|nr:UvrB/UvrC motif-containing protein [Chthoniobacterales bacterium]